MAAKIQQEINKSQNQKLLVVCRDCKHSTNHLVLASTDLTGSDDLGEGHVIDWYSCYQILQCQGCDSISFRKASHTSEDYIQVGYEEYELDVFEEIFPNPKEGRLPLKDVDMLPTDVERIYSETLKAINFDQPVLSGIGIRALIETISKERKANGRDLMQKIDDLVAQGVLTKDGAEIFHKLRVLGNTAAHEVKPHPRDQLNLALDVVEHLLQGVYILPLHARRQFT
jgi:Domain of unknown function (DUF4145)